MSLLDLFRRKDYGKPILGISIFTKIENPTFEDDPPKSSGLASLVNRVTAEEKIRKCGSASEIAQSLFRRSDMYITQKGYLLRKSQQKHLYFDFTSIPNSYVHITVDKNTEELILLGAYLCKEMAQALLEPVTIVYQNEKTQHILADKDRDLYIEEIKMAYEGIKDRGYPEGREVIEQLKLAGTIKLDT